MSLEQIQKEIEDVYTQYNDQNCRDKILEFVQKELRERLQTHISRKKRLEDLEKNSRAYINDFLLNSDMQFSYISNSNIFISYNGEDFKLINESEILHTILSNISLHKHLMPWKQKIKISIMKQIKDLHMFNIIPESHTIQYVISHITPLILQTKAEAKYFLTILGDNILKKNTNYIHLVDIKSKEFLRALEENLFHFFKNLHHLNTTFKYTWYDHEYDKCRIINFNKSVTKNTYWNSFVKYHILDIVSVAIYYSKRYNSSEAYLACESPERLAKTNIMYLKGKTEQTIVDEFIADNIIQMDNVTITWNEMYYIWKEFLKRKGLPAVIFLKNLKQQLINSLDYKSATDNFIGATSAQLKIIKNLHSFWDNNILTGDNDELETSELSEIYNNWLTNNNHDNVSEETLISLIVHFYDVEPEDGKYLKNIKCILWNKQEEIRDILEDLKITYKFSPDAYEKGVYKVYNDYCAKATKKFNYRIVSKKYFEKYIHQIIPDKYIIKNRILNDYWSS